MYNTSDIVSAIATRIVTLMPTYTALDYQYDLLKNKFDSADNRYAILPLEATEISGVTKWYTLDHRFRVTLTSSYVSDQLGDESLQTAIKTLMTYCLDLYKDFYDNRVASALNIHEIAIDEPVLIESEKIVAVSMTFLLTYRRQLGI